MTTTQGATRVALVTGSSRGIGAAIVRALAARGHRVALNCLKSTEEAARVLAECGGAGAVFRADARDPAAVKRMVAEVERTLGPVDVAVHNANIDFPVGPFWLQKPEEVAAKMQAEVGALHALVASTVPGMLARGFGRVVAVSSMMSRFGSAGFATHAAAKAAVDAAVNVLAREVGSRGVTANVVAPGAVETRSTAYLAPEVRAWIERTTPARRLATPEDIAGAVALLASDEARWINGQYLQLDGGLGGPLPYSSEEIIKFA